MLVTVPDYYNKFKCIAEKCTDNCCIGWEIDVDSNTYEKYNNLNDCFGIRIKENIILSDDGNFTFKLDKNERCPFLNEKNLCDIIIEKGEDFLCDICREHPRFHNCFGNRRETGIGIGCIAAAEIVISQKHKTEFVTYQCDEPELEIDYDQNFLDYLKKIRNDIFAILQNRNKNLNERLSEILLYGEKMQSEIDGIEYKTTVDFTKNYVFSDYKNMLKKLLPLNDQWTCAVESLEEKSIAEINTTEYEQLAVYFIYRHFISSVYDSDIISRIKFTVLCCLTIFWISDTYSLAEKACLVSKEIEYCSENIDLLLDFSYTEKCMSAEALLSVLAGGEDSNFK